MKLIKNAQILDNGELKQASILIDGQHIKEINNNIEVDENVEVIDAQGHFVAPGLIDVHVHLREPGGEHKETIKTGTKAAHVEDSQPYVQCLIHVQYQTQLNIWIDYNN